MIVWRSRPLGHHGSVIQTIMRRKIILCFRLEIFWGLLWIFFFIHPFILSPHHLHIIYLGHCEFFLILRQLLPMRGVFVLNDIIRLLEFVILGRGLHMMSLLVTWDQLTQALCPFHLEGMTATVLFPSRWRSQIFLNYCCAFSATGVQKYFGLPWALVR